MSMALMHAQTVRWTVDQFQQLSDAQIFPDDVQVELIEGEIVIKPPMNPPHGNAVMRATRVLSRAFQETHWIRCQLPLIQGDNSTPFPDLTLVEIAGFDQEQHPRSADLVVEVSDSSLEFDRDEKASVYARHGVREYWIVNLVDHVVEVHRDPGPDPTTLGGGRWSSKTVHASGDSIAPLFRPEMSVAVSDLLG